MIKEMNTAIVNNLFEFWKHIGTLTNRLSANKNYSSVSMTTSDWPNRVFDVTNNDDALLQEIKELSQDGKLPEILSVMNHADSLNNSDFELVFQQKNMAIDLHKFSESTITNSNIKAVKSEKEATRFAKVATEAFGYLVDEKVVFEIVRNSSQTQLFTYQENGEVLGCGIVFFDTNHYAGLHMIGTIPKGRGKGIGKSMTKHLLQIAKNNTATHCVLHASKMGESIYKKLGFETYGELKNYRILKRK